MLLSHPSGTLFTITSKSSHLSLSIQNSQSPCSSRIIGVPHNPQELCQLWYLAPIPSLSLSPPSYTLISAVSDLTLQESSNEIRLVKDSKKKLYGYRVEQHRIGKQVYYVLRNLVRTDYVGSLEGILKSKVYEEDEEGNQLFRIEECRENRVVGMTCIMVGEEGGVIGVGKEGKIEIKEREGKFSERWIMVQVFNNWVVKNFKTGMVMELGGNGKGGKEVGMGKRGKELGEIWVVERVGGDKEKEKEGGWYYVRNLSLPEYWLGVDNGKLGMGKKGYRWRLEGFKG